MRLFIVSICFLVPFEASGQEAETTITDRERWESRVFEWLADMTSNRDAILRKRYVVLIDSVLIEPQSVIPTGSGDTFRFKTVDIPQESQQQHIYARQHNRFDYRALCQIQAAQFSRQPDPQHHAWFEFLHAKSTIRGRKLRINDGDRSAGPYADKPKDKSLGEWWKTDFLWAGGLTPYDSFMPHEFMRSKYLPESVEDVFFKRGELTKVSRSLGGLMQSAWNINTAFKPVILRVTHDPNKDWMPTEISLKPGKDWPKNIKLDTYVRLSNWQKVDGFWLPHIIEQSQDIGGTDRKDVRLAKFQWAIGKDAPDAAFDVNSEDLREPIMKHFGAEFMAIEDGQLRVAPFYETPEDLRKAFHPELAK